MTFEINMMLGRSKTMTVIANETLKLVKVLDCMKKLLSDAAMANLLMGTRPIYLKLFPYLNIMRRLL